MLALSLSLAYMYYVAAKRPEIKDANPEASFGELGKLVGAAWKALSEEDKKEYNEKAAEESLGSAGTEESVSPHLLEPPCTRAIKQWLDDLREILTTLIANAESTHIPVEDREEYVLRQIPTLFQGYFVDKMIDLVVPKVDGERVGEGYTSYSFRKLSFPKLEDIEKRDRVSAYMLSLLSDEERTKILYRLDKLEAKLL